MEFAEVLARRRMVRNYSTDPVGPDVLERVLAASQRAPSAGNSQGTDIVALVGADAVAAYWDVTLPAERRAGFPWPGLLNAPVLALVVANPDAYVRRYAEPDKVATGLGEGVDEWSVPFWYVDAGASIMAMLLAATAEGLGALLFGAFGHEQELKRSFSVPDSCSIAGIVALGHPAKDRPSRSTARSPRPVSAWRHEGRW